MLLIPHAWETEEEQEAVIKPRNSIFWYGFGQGLIQGLTTVSGYLSRWLHEHWEYILRRMDLHKTYEIHTFREGGDEARKPREGDLWTTTLYDEIFIPFKVGEAARENYVQTSYVNDVNRAYAETLMEYQLNGSGSSLSVEAGSIGSPERTEGMGGTVVSIYEYGLQRLSYRDMGSKELFTYLYDGRGSVSNLTSQSGSSVLSYVYDAYGMSTVYPSADNSSLTSGIGNPYSYNGEFTDPDTGFQYLRSRYCNIRTGSFLTEDTYSGSILEPLSQNRYTYTGNNPVNLTDPSGHAWISGTVAKVAAAKKTTSKAGAVKSGAATALKNATKNAVTAAKNTSTRNSQTSKAASGQNTNGIQTAATNFFNASTPSISSSKSSGGSGKITSSAAKTTWQQTIANSTSGTGAGTVRKITTGHTYINNKLFTAISAKEQKLCSSAGRATAGAIPTAALAAQAIPGVFEGLWALLATLGGTLAGAIGGIVSSAILPVVLIGAVVVGIAVLGIEGYKHLTAGKVAIMPTIADQILEMARKKKEEQETIKVGPEDYDIINPDGSKVDMGGGGGSQNNNDDNGEENPAPIKPKPESNSSGSENVSEVNGEHNFSSQIHDLMNRIPNQYKTNGQCDVFSQKLIQLLSENGIPYEIIRVDSKFGIYSDKAGEVIGVGYHYGIKIGDIIYDNMTPNGISFSAWLEDLGLTSQPSNIIKWSIVDKILNY